VRRHFLRVFEGAAVDKVGGDAGRPERMAADRLGDAGGESASAVKDVISAPAKPAKSRE
jgi:hypothetical protein